MTELICIVCPNGCHLRVDEENGFKVTGNRCERGTEYGYQELTAPTRVITSTVIVTGGMYPRCSVKTSVPVAKSKIFEVMKALEGVTVSAPVKLGDVIIHDAAGSGADIVATKDIREER